MSKTVLIAGGGASGVLTAVALLQRSPDVRVVTVEPRERLGAGVAYSTTCPAHVLNVPAANMSAFADVRDDFVRWLQTHRPGEFDANSFVPRSIYGEYVAAIAAAEAARAGFRWRHVRALAQGVEVHDGVVRLALSNGEVLSGDRLVVATGNAAPAAWAGITKSGAEYFFGSAWEHDALTPRVPTETVLLLGTGLTAVDAVLGLQYNGHRGVIYMVSRRGLLPHEHRLFDSPPEAQPDAQSMRDLIGIARRGNWRALIDRVRPVANVLWQAQAVADKRRFMRHFMPYWNVHRHRLAPAAAKAIADAIAADTLRVLAGRTRGIAPAQNGTNVTIQLRGENETLVVNAGRIINCSGPEHDYQKLPNPLIRSLLDQGLMTPSALDIGVEVAQTGALVDRAGVASERIFAIGPVRYGTLIETTAIPEIRVQAQELADLFVSDFFKEARTTA